MSRSPFSNTMRRLSSFECRIRKIMTAGDAGVGASIHEPFSSADNSGADVAVQYSPNDLAVKAAQEKKEDINASLPRSLIAPEKDCIAPFRGEEVVLGPLLGSGEFANVHEIESFCLQKEDLAQDGIAFNTDEIERRLYMKTCEKYRQTNKPRYALKHVKDKYLKNSLKQSKNSDAYVQAARDISLEAEILASLNHPNIIKLRGRTHADAAGFSQGPSGYFLILDCLFETLDKRIKFWRDLQQIRDPGKQGGRFSMSRRISKLQQGRRKDHHLKNVELNDEMMDERLSIALQISAAVMYLHSHCVIFRDLKPANIGFDVRGDVKIFDFGLARIMPEDGLHYDETFEMSGAGSPRYMAPECLSGKDYNMKADVYSFAVLLWEMLAGQIPYLFAKTMPQLVEHVVNNGGRPHIYESWSPNIKDTMERSFDSEIERRPEMAPVHCCITETLTTLRGGNGVGLNLAFINRRRSLQSFRLTGDQRDLLMAANVSREQLQT